MKKVFALILAVLLTFSPVSCNWNDPGDSDEALIPTVIFGKDVAVYGNTVFYRDTNAFELKYQNMENIQSTGFRLYQDLLETEKNPFQFVTGGTSIIVDPIATEKNGGAPILYIALNKSDRMVVSFNTATQQMRILKNDLSGRFMNLFLYGEHLVFLTDEGDLGRRIHSIKTDGTDYHTLENPDKLMLDIHNIWNGEVYFTDGTGNLYKAPLSMDSFSFVLDDCGGAVCFGGDYLYYNEMSTFYYRRVNLSDPSVKETVIERPVVGIVGESLYLYLTLGDDDESVYLYHAKTNENQMVYEDIGKKQYRCFSEDYICFRDVSEKTVYYYDMATKKEIKIPY